MSALIILSAFPEVSGSVAMFAGAAIPQRPHPGSACPADEQSSRWNPAELRPRKLCRPDVLVCNQLLVSHPRTRPFG